MEKYIQEIKHYYNEHKKVVIAVGIIFSYCYNIIGKK